MKKFIIRRFGVSLVTLFVISIIVFGLARAGGDPLALMLDDYATVEQEQELRTRLGLDKSYVEQYMIFIKNAARGDLGKRILDQQSVTGAIVDRFPATLQLGLAAFIFSIIVGVPLGILSSVKRDSIWDQLGKLVALMGQSMPPFWLGIMMIFFFAVKLDWINPSGREGWNSFILPAITLGWFFVAANMRIVRSAMLDVLDSEYIKLARAKGVASGLVIWRHALPNALIPPITFLGITLGFLITGSVVAETVFQWPGLGMLAFESVQKSDYPMLQGIVLVFGVMYIVTSFLVDVLYAYIDPRIRYG
ncbi:MAG: ABC transporter permease [Dehalococcoidia bacterium]